MKSKLISSFIVNGSLALICLLWTIPTIGLLISSFRDRLDINVSGWWTVFPHKDWVSVQQITPDASINRDVAMTLGGVTGTFEQFTQGIAQNGERFIWVGNRRVGYLDIEKYQWTANTTFTMENYKQVLASGN